MSDDDAPAAAAARLCLDCGLCCNGVLFDLVRLQPGDRAKALTAKGLKIKKGQWFTQPCTALSGRLCQIYAHRPGRCRLFECRQYQRVAAGEESTATALARIEHVRKAVARMEELLVACTGGGNVRKPLTQRYATAMAALPCHQSSEVDAVRATLTEAMNALQQTLDVHFRVA